MQGLVGCCSVDAYMLKKWCGLYKRASQALREELAKWVELLMNESPPWAMIRALMGCRMAALDKQGCLWQQAAVRRPRGGHRGRGELGASADG